jgi:tRNA(fMet)-specific endonuclease VapC
MPAPYLLDTDHCIADLQGTHPAHARVAARLAATSVQDLRVALFTAMEYHQARSALHTFLGWIPLVGITHLTIEEFGRLRAMLRRQNQLIGDLDLAIAATALTHGLTLVTHNTRHFSRIPGLPLEDWYP